MESNQYCSSLVSPVARTHLRECCVTIVVCVCVTFQSIHVVIENTNASHTHDILIVWYQVHDSNSLATFKGVSVLDFEHTRYKLQGAHFGQRWTRTHAANVTQTHCIYSKGDVALHRSFHSPSLLEIPSGAGDTDNEWHYHLPQMEL